MWPVLTCPPLGSSIRLINRRVVLLPLPEGPTIATFCPAFIFKLTPRNKSPLEESLPYWKVTFLSSGNTTRYDTMLDVREHRVKEGGRKKQEKSSKIKDESKREGSTYPPQRNRNKIKTLQYNAIQSKHSSTVQDSVNVPKFQFRRSVTGGEGFY